MREETNMDDNRLLFDAFEICYDRGVAAFRKNESPVARKRIFVTVEPPLKIAKRQAGL